MSNLVASNLIDRVSGESTPMLNAVKGSAKAWVNFDGTTNPPSIRGSFNVLGITDNGTGDYTVNFETNMDNANFSVGGTASRTAAIAEGILSPFQFSVSSVRFGVNDNASNLTDEDYISVQIFGGID